MILKLVINALIYDSSAETLDMDMFSACFVSILGVGCIYLWRIYVPTDETCNWCQLCVCPSSARCSLAQSSASVVPVVCTQFTALYGLLEVCHASFRTQRPPLMGCKRIAVTWMEGYNNIMGLCFGHGASTVGVIVKQKSVCGPFRMVTVLGAIFSPAISLALWREHCRH